MKHLKINMSSLKKPLTKKSLMKRFTKDLKILKNRKKRRLMIKKFRLNKKLE